MLRVDVNRKRNAKHVIELERIVTFGFQWNAESIRYLWVSMNFPPILLEFVESKPCVQQPFPNAIQIRVDWPLKRLFSHITRE